MPSRYPTSGHPRVTAFAGSTASGAGMPLSYSVRQWRVDGMEGESGPRTELAVEPLKQVCRCPDRIV